MSSSFTGLVEAGAGAIAGSVSQLPITEFGVVLLSALVLGLLLTRFGISSSVGFILAGLLLGQQGLNYISHTGISASLGEIGMLAILFYLGLEVNLRKFKETGGIALVFAFIEMAGAFAVGFILASLFGFSNFESILIGSMLAAASTVEAIKFILEKNILKSLESRIAISVLIVQDICAVLFLVFLSSLASHHSFNLAALNAVIFIIAMFFVVGKVSRPLLNLLESWGHHDKMVLFALGTGIAVSFIGVFLGLSAILGAYFAGFALSETRYADRIKHELGFFRELFLLFFFVSFGAKVLLPNSLTIVALILAIVVIYTIVKVLSYGVFGTAIGLNVPSSVAIGAIMLPIGEFGILIASTAGQLNPANCTALGNCLVSDPSGLLSIAFAVTILTTLIGPFVFNRIDSAASLLVKLYPSKIRRRIAIVGDQITGLENLFITSAFQNKTAILLKNLISNLVIAISVVYLAFVLRQEITLTFLQFLPTELALSLLLLPIIVWPLYNFARELKQLVTTVEQGVYGLAFKSNSRGDSLAFDLIAGFLMTVLGIVAAIIIYSTFPQVLLAIIVPAVYTILAVVHLGKSAHAFLNRYSHLEPRSISRRNSK